MDANPAARAGMAVDFILHELGKAQECCSRRASADLSIFPVPRLRAWAWPVNSTPRWRTLILVTSALRVVPPCPRAKVMRFSFPNNTRRRIPPGSNVCWLIIPQDESLISRVRRLAEPPAGWRTSHKPIAFPPQRSRRVRLGAPSHEPILYPPERSDGRGVARTSSYIKALLVSRPPPVAPLGRAMNEDGFGAPTHRGLCEPAHLQITSKFVLRSPPHKKTGPCGAGDFLLSSVLLHQVYQLG
jgi:hypothetical protein